MSEPLFRGKTALITGGSSGIGLDLAACFLKDGAHAVLVSSNSDKLQSAGSGLEKKFGIKPLLLTADLAHPDAPKDIFHELLDRRIAVDILVNNAGFGVYGQFHTQPYEKFEKMIDVNARAVVSLTGLFIPGMIGRRFGRILNVASTAAFQPIPIEAVYAASKAFLLHFSEALSNELKGSGVGVTCLCPGPTTTPFFTREIFPAKMMKRRMMKSEDVARMGYEALKSGKPLVVAGFKNWILSQGHRFLPRTWAAQIARKVVE